MKKSVPYTFTVCWKPFPPHQTVSYSIEIEDGVTRWQQYWRRSEPFLHNMAEPSFQRWWFGSLALFEVFLMCTTPEDARFGAWLSALFAGLFIVQAMWAQIRVNDERIAHIAERLLRGGPHDRH